MIRCNSPEVAAHYAAQYGEWYGMSCLNGNWYVGTPEQLWNVGVVSGTEQRPPKLEIEEC